MCKTLKRESYIINIYLYKIKIITWDEHKKN